MRDDRAGSDYDRVATAIAFLLRHAEERPSLAALASELGLSPFHCQRLFRRWAGVSPKRFLQAVTVERAKALLQERRPLLEVADRLGLGSGSRLYDHFVQLEALTPGEYRSGGAGLTIDYGIHSTPFGPALIATTARGICGLAFVAPDEDPVHTLAQAWPAACLRANAQRTAPLMAAIFHTPRASAGPLSLHVGGTNFQIQVWRALLRLPAAALASYQEVAQAVGRPGAAQAVGQAIGANPVALLIPCHRVIRQSGALGGYRWGVARKCAIQVWEAARYGQKT